MANKRFRSQFLYGDEAMPVMLHLKAAIGASGAPTLNENLSKGIASIARNSAGNYTITLKDKYVRLIHADADQRNGTSAVAAPLFQVEADNSNASSPTIDIQLRDIAEAATDPANGEDLNIMLILSNSSVGN